MKKSALRQLIKENIISILKEDSYKKILLDKINACSLSEEEKLKLITDLEDANNIPKVAAKLEAATGSVKESLSNEERIEKAAFDDGWDAGYKVGYQVGYQDAKDGHPPGITEVKEVNSYLKALESDLARMKSADPKEFASALKRNLMIKDLEKKVKEVKDAMAKKDDMAKKNLKKK